MQDSPHRTYHPRRAVHRPGRAAGCALPSVGVSAGGQRGLCGRGHAHGVVGRPDAGGADVLRGLPAAAGLRRSGCVAAGARDADRGSAGRLLPEEAALAARFGKSGDPARAAAMRTALVTGLALLLHNFPEGVLTFFAGTADPSLGLRTAAAIALHNIPEGLAVAVPFAYATRRRTAGGAGRARLRSGRAARCGRRGCSCVGSSRRAFSNCTVVLAAGVMVWVALAQLLPGALHPAHRTAGILGAAVGCLLMLLGIAALP